MIATTIGANGAPVDVTSQVTWSSSNSLVATINAGGLLTALAPGGVDVNAATEKGATASVSVTIEAPPAPEAKLDARGMGTTERAIYSWSGISPIEFDASASTGDGLTYRFDFGDGRSYSGGPRTSHTYEEFAGLASVTVTDRYGRSSTALTERPIQTLAPFIGFYNWWETYSTPPLRLNVTSYQPASQGKRWQGRVIRHGADGGKNEGATGSFNSDLSVDLRTDSGVTFTGSAIFTESQLGYGRVDLRLTQHSGLHDGVTYVLLATYY